MQTGHCRCVWQHTFDRPSQLIFSCMSASGRTTTNTRTKCALMNKMCSINFVREKCKPAVDTVPKIDILRELICVRDSNHNIPGFNRDEVLEMINDICED